MTKEELKNKVGFIADDQVGKTIQMYVTTDSTGLQLFNIVDGDLVDLLKMFTASVKQLIIDKAEYEVEAYSTSLKRVDVIHEYDLTGNLTDEMSRMIDVEGILVPECFDKSQTRIEKINAIYIVIKSNDNQNSLTLYKAVSNVDKTYASSTFFIFGKQDRVFERQKENMLKVTPAFHMMQVDGTIFLVDLDRLEKPLHLDAVLERETMRDVGKLSGDMVINNNHLLKICKKPSVCKKLRHALQFSKVVKKIEDGSLTGPIIINFVKTKTNLIFHYNRGNTKFEIKNDAEAMRFVKLMDDDYLLSELTGEKYDSLDKNSMA